MKKNNRRKDHETQKTLTRTPLFAAADPGIFDQLGFGKCP
jgi:hypothetical protein